MSYKKIVSPFTRDTKEEAEKMLSTMKEVFERRGFSVQKELMEERSDGQWSVSIVC